ncbi:reverse transcriptase [Plakobranchus ocellatus]|uniref:Reverse transcriptase n=1 Tax=Plakobranchus ocellatus TaxID=259542 RepID=A0AAV4CXX8_9GAST|nr:reverse transcriptase [Plakobranchus ocellatus]
MIIDEIRNKEDSTWVQKAVQQPQQGQWTNWDTAIQRSLTWNDIWHMAPLRISFLIKSVYDLLPSNANVGRWASYWPKWLDAGFESLASNPGGKKNGSREASGHHVIDVARPP